MVKLHDPKGGRAVTRVGGAIRAVIVVPERVDVILRPGRGGPGMGDAQRPARTARQVRSGVPPSIEGAARSSLDPALARASWSAPTSTDHPDRSVRSALPCVRAASAFLAASTRSVARRAPTCSRSFSLSRLQAPQQVRRCVGCCAGCRGGSQPSIPLSSPPVLSLCPGRDGGARRSRAGACPLPGPRAHSAYPATRHLATDLF